MADNKKETKWFIMGKSLIGGKIVTSQSRFSYPRAEAERLKALAASTFPATEYWLEEDKEEQDENE